MMLGNMIVLFIFVQVARSQFPANQKVPSVYPKDWCAVGTLDAIVHQKPTVIRVLNSTYDDESGFVPLWGECVVTYRCLLDEPTVVREQKAVCLRRQKWNYAIPSCEDNIVKLEHIVSDLEKKDGVPMAQLFNTKVGIVKAIIFSADLDEDVLDQSENVTTPKPEPMTTAMRMTTTAKLSRSSKQNNLSDKMKSFMKIVSLCYESKMCARVAALQISCQRFAGVRMLRMLCQTCVKHVCCSGKTLLLSGGRTCL